MHVKVVKTHKPMQSTVHPLPLVTGLCTYTQHKCFVTSPTYFCCLPHDCGHRGLYTPHMTADKTSLQCALSFSLLGLNINVSQHCVCGQHTSVQIQLCKVSGDMLCDLCAAETQYADVQQPESCQQRISLCEQ